MIFRRINLLPNNNMVTFMVFCGFCQTHKIISHKTRKKHFFGGLLIKTFYSCRNNEKKISCWNLKYAYQQYIKIIQEMFT